MKICSKCLIEKEYSEFYKDLVQASGLTCRCKECIKLDVKERRKDVKFVEKRREISRKSQLKRRLRREVIDSQNEYRKNRYKNDEEYRNHAIATASKWRSEKRKKDPSVRAIDNARRRLNAFFKEIGRKLTRGLGCNRDTFKNHLESLFQPGMTWGNYGQWHIDHKYPLSLAIKEGEESFKKACNYMNLQPLWAEDNLKKGNKV